MSTKQLAPSTRSALRLAAAILIGLGIVIGIASLWLVPSRTPQEVMVDSQKVMEDLTRQKLKMRYEQQRGQRTLAQQVTDPIVGPVLEARLAKGKADRAAARAELQTNRTANKVSSRESSWRLEVVGLRLVEQSQGGMFRMEADIKFSGSSGAPSGPVDLLFHADTAQSKKAMARTRFNIQSESTLTVSSDAFVLDAGDVNKLSVELQPYSTLRPTDRTLASLEATLTNGKTTVTEPVYGRVQPRPGEIEVHIRGGRTADQDQVAVGDGSVGSMAEMTRIVADWLEQNPQRPCLIRTDRAAHYETLVKVRETLERAGIRAGIGLDQSLFFRIPLQELGIDLESAPKTTKWGDLPDVFEEDPPGSHSYRTRQEVVGFSLGLDRVFFVPAKSSFYVQSDPLFSSTMTYYGPLPGDLKALMDKIRAWHPTVAMAQGWVEYSKRILESVKTRHEAGSSTDAQLAVAKATLQQAQDELARALETGAPPESRK
jgi:biopolymer transport protein ExbD